MAYFYHLKGPNRMQITTPCGPIHLPINYRNFAQSPFNHLLLLVRPFNEGGITELFQVVGISRELFFLVEISHFATLDFKQPFAHSTDHQSVSGGFRIIKQL